MSLLLFCAFCVLHLQLQEIVAKPYRILSGGIDGNRHIIREYNLRIKRQGFGNNEIIFDNENAFNDFPQRNRPTQNTFGFGTSRFQGSDLNSFGANLFQGSDENPFGPTDVQESGSSSQAPPRSTTIAIPGMGTTRSSCEDRCQTTPEYNPVCGDNNVTYFNRARYRCAVNCGINVRIMRHRACPVFASQM